MVIDEEWELPVLAMGPSIDRELNPTWLVLDDNVWPIEDLKEIWMFIYIC